MAIGELTKQIAQQAILSATTKEPVPPPQPENLAATFLGQIAAMQKALKEDEELLVFYSNGPERVRVMEIFAPSREVAVLSGVDADRNRTRVICALAALQLTCKVTRVPAGAKPVRIGLINQKPKDSNG
ncbi:MAG TPA: hypothetical protein VMH81_17050 [Bryobacteraceae bacterium]|nr:hypothetical protein [Bryobacteraceae bacterium]